MVLNNYLSNSLEISEQELSRIEVKCIWQDSKKSMIFAEFFSVHMCHIVYKHMSNLKETERIEKYIHPSLKPTYYNLTHQAYNLRHNLGYYSTRIDYTRDGLALLFKSIERSDWEEADLVNPDHSNTPAIPQLDGSSSHLQKMFYNVPQKVL